jgi:CPA2 family monovalent cation:H+ antiporter-2
LHRLVEPLRDMFSAVFFVAIGMLLDPRHLVDYAVPVLIITPLYVLAKVGACAFGAFMAGCEARVAMRVGTGLAQLGEFAFILATLGLSLGAIGDHLYPIVVAVAVLNAVIRPYLVENSDRLTAGWPACCRADQDRADPLQRLGGAGGPSPEASIRPCVLCAA